jgi:hypothetical protein
MWSNSFLQNLEIRLPRPFFCGSRARPRVTRLVSHVSGRWIIDVDCGEPFEARFVRGWIFGDGAVVGLTLRAGDGRNIHRLLYAMHHEPDTWRRLLVRLRLAN